MSDRIQDKVTAFDTLFTTNYIQKLKILMPYFDPSMQKNIAVYIKYLELQYTLNFFRHHPSANVSLLSHESSMNYGKLFGEMIPYCTESERSQMENMQNMFRTFEQYKEMMEMIQMMQEMFPEGENPMNTMFGGGNSQGSGGMDLSQLAQMAQMFGGGDMSQMAQMFGGGDMSQTMGDMDLSQMAQIFQMFQPQGGNTENGENQ